MPKVFVHNDEREYVEQYDLHSKYERRPKESVSSLQELSFSQFAKIYESWWGKPLEKEEQESCQSEVCIAEVLVTEEDHDKNSQKKRTMIYYSI